MPEAAHRYCRRPEGPSSAASVQSARKSSSRWWSKGLSFWHQTNSRCWLTGQRVQLILSQGARRSSRRALDLLRVARRQAARWWRQIAGPGHWLRQLHLRMRRSPSAPEFSQAFIASVKTVYLITSEHRPRQLLARRERARASPIRLAPLARRQQGLFAWPGGLLLA